jgi:hypothetical protein
MILSEHTGRSPLLKLDPVILTCNHWHTLDFALDFDGGIVCVIQLRLLISRQIEGFDRMIMAASQSHQRPKDTSTNHG